MFTYAKLTTGEIKVVFSDNCSEETMDLFRLSELEDYNPEYISCQNYPYSEIAKTDTNLASL